MSKLEREIHIDAPAEAVYDKLTDPQCLDDWVTVHEALEEAPDRNVEVGDTLVQRMKVAGQKIRITWHVDEAERPSRVVWTGKGPMGTEAKATYEIRTNGDSGVTFSYVNEYDLPGGPIGKLAGRAIVGTSGREADKSLARLKDLIENGSSSNGSSS
jgi:carbon monoxide dehydrogenase subunit G